MDPKNRFALVVGLVFWSAATAAVLILADSSVFPILAAVFSLLTIPGMVVLTRYQISDVEEAEKGAVARRFGMIVTMVQYPLDTLGFTAVLFFGFPPTNPTHQHVLVIALLIGYLWLLGVPWFIGYSVDKHHR